MDLTFLIAVFVIIAVLGAWWQFSIITKKVNRNFKSITTNPVLKGERGRKQQVGLIVLLVIVLVSFQWAGLLF